MPPLLVRAGAMVSSIFKAKESHCSAPKVGILTVASNRNHADGHIAQENGNEQQAGPPIIVLGLVELECLLEALFVLSVVVLLVAILLLLHRRRVRIALAVLGRLLSICLSLVCALRLLGWGRRRAARVIILSFAHCDDDK